MRGSKDIPVDNDFIVSRLSHISWKRFSRDLTWGPTRSARSPGGRRCGARGTREVCCCEFTSITGGGNIRASRDPVSTRSCLPLRWPLHPLPEHEYTSKEKE